MEEEIFKKFGSGEELPARPNYGETTEYFSWPFTAKFWEVNFALPAIRGDAHDVNALKSWWRRRNVVRLESQYSSNPELLSTTNRVFEEDLTLSPFLESPIARFVYMHHHLLPFIQRFSPEDCATPIARPGDDTLDRTQSFVQQMANGGLRPVSQTANGSDQRRGDAETILALIHGATPDGARLKPYVFQQLHATILAGTRERSAKNKKFNLEHLDEQIELFPYLFRKMSLSSVYQKLQINLEKFYTCMAQHSNAVGKFGRFEDWGETWADMDRGRGLADNDSESDEDNGATSRFDTARKAAGVLRETANLQALQAYYRMGTDAKQASLTSYIDRHIAEGVHAGDHSTITVSYYRPWGLPGRMYAYGPAGQKLTKLGRAAAFDGVGVDVDFENCHSRLGFSYSKQALKNPASFPIWLLYNTHPKAWRQLVTEYMGGQRRRRQETVDPTFVLRQA